MTKQENKRSVELLWENYLRENPDNNLKKQPISFYFCDNEKDANECAELDTFSSPFCHSPQ